MRPKVIIDNEGMVTIVLTPLCIKCPHSEMLHTPKTRFCQKLIKPLDHYSQNLVADYGEYKSLQFVEECIKESFQKKPCPLDEKEKLFIQVFL